MNAKEIQQRLKDLGYDIVVDGKFGPKSQEALKKAYTDGKDTKLTNEDVNSAAAELGISPAKIWTVVDVESSAASFTDGRPTILYEPHIFSRLTNHKYDASHPDVSSRKWNRKLYPGSQSGRYAQMLKAAGLDADAAIQSSSYGAFQILGCNYKICGYPTAFDFIYAQSQSEKDQLKAFINFIKNNKLVGALKAGNWAAFAKGYNGTSYKENKYDIKLAKAYAERSK